MMLALGSCGEFVEFDEEDVVAALLKLDRRNVDLMVGDKFVLPAKLTPDTLPDMTVYWESGDKQIITLKDDTIMAVGAGKTFVVATAVNGLVTDTSRITVYPYWEQSPKTYPYDMMVFASVTSAGRTMDGDLRVAAFCDDELRGVGELMKHGNTPYMFLRIYSPTAEQEKIVLRCYDRKRALVVEHPDTIVFDGETHGTLSDLYELNFK
jgi:hypothetical protein